MSDWADEIANEVFRTMMHSTAFIGKQTLAQSLRNRDTQARAEGYTAGVEEAREQVNLLRGALQRIAAHRKPIEREFKIVTGYEENMIDEAEEALAALAAEPQVEDRYQGYNKGAFDDGAEARIVHDATITECPQIEQAGWAYVQAWRAGWWDADRELKSKPQVEESRP